MKPIAVLLLCLSILAFAPGLSAEDNTCRLAAPPQDDVWVIVYDSDADGNRGEIIWQGIIPAGKEVAVTSSSGYIRYNYKRDKYQAYDGDIAVGCYQKRAILVD